MYKEYPHSIITIVC